MSRSSSCAPSSPPRSGPTGFWPRSRRAGLQHPHILPLFDSGEVDRTVFYVMPLVDGESLRERLVRETHLPIADALTIAAEVAGALDYAHRHGIVHRDVKPDARRGRRARLEPRRPRAVLPRPRARPGDADGGTRRHRRRLPDPRAAHAVRTAEL